MCRNLWQSSFFATGAWFFFFNWQSAFCILCAIMSLDSVIYIYVLDKMIGSLVSWCILADHKSSISHCCTGESGTSTVQSSFNQFSPCFLKMNLPPPQHLFYLSPRRCHRPKHSDMYSLQCSVQCIVNCTIIHSEQCTCMGVLFLNVFDTTLVYNLVVR